MFFVGVTGQLLTLILTVGLPFIVLFSGHQKIELTQNNPTLEIYQEKDSNQNIDLKSYIFELNVNSECQEQHFDFNLDFSPLNKNPYKRYLQGWKSIYLSGSGNKAPPTLV